MRLHIIAGSLIIVAVLLVATAPALAQERATRRLPDAVAKTLKAAFPKAEITGVEIERENGVVKHTIEFTNGGMHKEVDIAADGTLLQEMTVVEAKNVPALAMDVIQKAATGGTIERIEHDEICCEPKDGKVIRLPKPITQYMVVIAKAEKAEMVVAADGTIIEPPWWDVPQGNSGSSDGSRGAEASQTGATEASSSNKTIAVTK